MSLRTHRIRREFDYVKLLGRRSENIQMVRFYGLMISLRVGSSGLMSENILAGEVVMLPA
ncbi:hypothetical protein ACFLS0_02925 [Candidatus Bipolaricaulota bacterium]